MSRKRIAIIKAETCRLEALGVVLGMLGLSTLQVKPAGRPRLYLSSAEKKRAYRKRKLEKVTELQRAQKLSSVTL